MGWTDADTHSAGYVVTSDDWYYEVKQNARYLKGKDGVPIIESGLIIDNTGGDEYLRIPSLTTTQRDALTPVAGMSIYNSTTTQFNKYENGAWKGNLDKEIFSPVTFATDMQSPVGAEEAYGLINAADEKTVCMLKIPWDFVAVVSAELILIGVTALTNMNLTFATSFGAEGESISTHTGGGTVTKTTVADTYHAIDLTLNNGVLNLAARDTLFVEAVYNATAPATNIKVVGARIRYSV